MTLLPANGTAVIVGGSIAGVTAAEELRLCGHTGPILMVDEQFHRPYSRPPLSKAVLSGVDSLESAYLPAMDDLQITLKLGSKAVDLALDERRIDLADGTSIHYDGLVIASGSTPLTLRDIGKNDTGIAERVLRTIDDAAELKAAFEGAASVIVVGGGILGMELASAAVSAGLATTVLTNEPPLMTMGGPFISRLVTKRALEAGVQVFHDPDGVELLEKGGRLAASLGGDVFESDLLVTTIGDRPRVDWLLRSGVADVRGVQIDDRCRVAEAVVAAGDITTWGPSRRRHPHWSAAMDQGRAAGKTLVMGNQAPRYVPRPYFWSDQFGIQLKMAGHMPFDGEPALIDGDEGSDRALYQWIQADTAVGALSINFSMPLARLHRLAGSGARLNEHSRS